MTPLREGDVVTGFFTGSVADKARPAVVVSGETYHAHRLTLIVPMSCFAF